MTFDDIRRLRFLAPGTSSLITSAGADELDRDIRRHMDGASRTWRAIAGVLAAMLVIAAGLVVQHEWRSRSCVRDCVSAHVQDSEARCAWQCRYVDCR